MFTKFRRWWNTANAAKEDYRKQLDALKQQLKEAKRNEEKLSAQLRREQKRFQTDLRELEEWYKQELARGKKDAAYQQFVATNEVIQGDPAPPLDEKEIAAQRREGMRRAKDQEDALPD